MEAASFVLTHCEAKLDRALGRATRLALGRYTGVVVIGMPIAWAVPGFHWGPASTYGLIAGVVLYGLVDVSRALKHPKPKEGGNSRNRHRG